jgi:hypothetical protein
VPLCTPNPSLEYGDIVPVADLLRKFRGTLADVILETSAADAGAPPSACIICGTLPA